MIRGVKSIVVTHVEKPYFCNSFTFPSCLYARMKKKRAIQGETPSTSESCNPTLQSRPAGHTPRSGHGSALTGGGGFEPTLAAPAPRKPAPGLTKRGTASPQGTDPLPRRGSASTARRRPLTSAMGLPPPSSSSPPRPSAAPQGAQSPGPPPHGRPTTAALQRLPPNGRSPTAARGRGVPEARRGEGSRGGRRRLSAPGGRRAKETRWEVR